MDEKMTIVSARKPDEFSDKVNAILREGEWRVAETEMSVTDSHYWAMLIKTRVEIKVISPVTKDEK